jgi:hypothetical protein
MTTIYRGHLLVSEEFFRDVLPNSPATPYFIRDVTWHTGKKSVGLKWESGTTQDVKWSDIESRIPGSPPTPVRAFVVPDRECVGFLFKGEVEGPFLKRRMPNLDVVLIGVLTTEGFRAG